MACHYKCSQPTCLLCSNSKNSGTTTVPNYDDCLPQMMPRPLYSTLLSTTINTCNSFLFYFSLFVRIYYYEAVTSHRSITHRKLRMFKFRSSPTFCLSLQICILATYALYLPHSLLSILNFSCPFFNLNGFLARLCLVCLRWPSFVPMAQGSPSSSLLMQMGLHSFPPFT